nr:phosphonate C-P lyase system protein PhnL [Roseospirillum parvum]
MPPNGPPTDPPTGPSLSARGLAKTFVLHTQGGVRLPVFSGLDLEVHPGSCLALNGPSGAGKSTLLRALYANYRPDAGQVLIRHDGALLDLTAAPPRRVLEVRRRTLGYVSQFLRVIPRVPALDIVAEPFARAGGTLAEGRDRAATLLRRLNVPERLWHVAPATFSGGEQQRVNIARSFIVDYPVLLLDEPTASLDAANRAVVVELIHQARARGAALVGIFHDREVRDAVADTTFELTAQRTAA